MPVHPLSGSILNWWEETTTTIKAEGPCRCGPTRRPDPRRRGTFAIADNVMRDRRDSPRTLSQALRR
jgi:hypothetical protein